MIANENQNISFLWSEERLENELKKYFGYNTFRAYQKEIIQALLRQEDVLAILPTGAGKSLCYQLPALVQPGTAIVVSPLISLMQDQVVSLFKNGISAAFLNSSLSYHDIQDVLSQLSDYKLLYVAPERLTDPQFLERLKEMTVSFFVIDEAHCISQWGHSFRVEYRKLSILKQIFPRCPVIALTATATPDVEKDIQTQLAMQRPRIIKGSFDRPNLTIKLHPKIQPEKQLQVFLEQQNNRSGIIYAATRKGVDNTFNQLQQAGFAVGRYHAGLSEQERSASQHAFLHDQLTLMVATVAFGMGIHKPDIRFIVHLNMPRTIEQYYQEIGRAGRDGLPAECLMLYGVQDFVVYKTFLEDVEDPVIRKQMKAKTESMYRLCTSLRCRRYELLRYFGENFLQEACGACDNCLEEAEQIDGTIIAQKILSCVYRLKQNVGIRMMIDVMRGSKNQVLLSRGYDQVSTYGLLRDLPEQEVRYYIESLLHLHLLKLTEGEYPVLKWTEQSPAVVNGQQLVYFKKRSFKAPKEERERLKRRETVTLHYDEHLFEVLRQLRLQIAREEEVPPYVVFSDRALQEMAVSFPQTQSEFVKINGVGPIKWVKYGEKFIEVIRPHAKQNPVPEREQVAIPLQRRHSQEETVSLYQQGHSLEQIMHIRQLAKSTILTHLAEAIEQGVDLDLSSLVSIEKQVIIGAVIAEVGAERLVPIKEKLPAEFSYDDIRLVAAYHRRTR
jgi:ATP-dependent DNA helicase RecQ